MKKARFSYGAHESQFMDMNFPEVANEALPLVALYHGGFWKSKYSLDLMTPIAEYLCAIGYTVANMEYVRVGEGMTHIEMIKGVFNSFDYLKKFESKAGYVAMGHSAGGYYALLLASRPAYRDSILDSGEYLRPTMVIAAAPITDLVMGHNDKLSDDGDAIQMFIGEIPDEYEYTDELVFCSPISNLPECPVHLVHGESDNVVRCKQSQIYASEMFRSNVPIEMVHNHILEATNHMDLINPEHHSFKFLLNLLG